MERKQERKFPSKVCPKSFRNLALTGASLLFIYLLCNATNEKKMDFLEIYKHTTFKAVPIKQLQQAVTNKTLKQL